MTQLIELLLLLSWYSSTSFGFVLPHPSLSHVIKPQRGIETKQWMAETTASVPSTETSDGDNEEDDDDEWEYVEFESLSEADLIKSEWLVGTCFERSENKIDETWCRLVTNEKGENLAIWGDNAEGRWALDVASQYITISKNSLWGKQIWACIVDDYYYLSGTVRSWNFFRAASVEAQWQARRLGVDKEEAGIAPWFQEDNEESPVPAIVESNEESSAPATVESSSSSTEE